MFNFSYIFYTFLHILYSSKFLCPRLLKLAVGYIAFDRDVASVRAYMRACVFQVRNQSLTNVKVYIRIHIDIYVRVSVGGHNLGIFNTRKLKFGMLLIKT